jgi:hypothetical protein
MAAGGANQNLQDKNRVKSVAALALVAQAATSIPLASSQAGDFSDGTTKWTQDPAGALGAHGLNRGVIPGSRLAFSVDPANLDVLAIGGKTFQFLTALGAAGANVQVKRGAGASATLTNLIAAINGDTTNANWVEATTPFAVTVVADAPIATQLRIRLAYGFDANGLWNPKRGGTAFAGVIGSTALTATITAGAAAWSNANLNATGKSPADVYESYGKVTITAAMITNGFMDIELPFTPTIYSVYVVDTTGLQRNITDLVTLAAGSIHIALAGGASPKIQATDVVHFWGAL